MEKLIIVTGGTIDKEYDPLTGEMDFPVPSHIPEMLRRINPFVSQAVVNQLFMIDSLQMTNAHRDQIAEAIVAAEQQSVVITHGTDTMVETAQYLRWCIPQSVLEERETRVRLTGAMVPYSVGTPQSNALSDLETAMVQSEKGPYDISIVMDGQVFDPNAVCKDRQLGRFVLI